ncbi:MAG TPA: glycosyl hydrolase [Lutibacter sp.]|nr:glycosyl hydrolase [Lutibacter sp.]
MKKYFILLLSLVLINTSSFAQKDKKETSLASGLKFRSIGPAFMSGRVSDFAVNPSNTNEYYVSFAAGHIWKTTNNGTTYKPVFDKQSSYSIGCLKLDPNNSNIVWAGTGENNHQRSVSYGDGIYKSLDGGKSWKNMGLKESRQIGMIAIDPRDTNIVFVAAEGSVWGSGGDRGLYKTIDGGKNWEKVLTISEDTGVNSVFIDAKNPDIMYATSEQRRRHVHIRIGGGPESAIWKSTDAGKTWRKLTSGLPKVDKGGIGLAISPVNTNYIYAIVEAAMKKGGFYKSTDQGESWTRMSDYNTSGQYYSEIVCDPIDVNTVYSTETRSKVTHDGGKTWKLIGQNKRHVDDHALWIDPTNTNHFIIGGDGGVYETFDDGKEFIHKTNLPVTQFYRVNVDNDFPFYNVFGGTQDNNSFGGPSNTIYTDGSARSEWTITLGGDGYWQAIDPENTDIVYSEYQYGNLFRYDKKSGERIAIKPQPRKGEDTYKWNWNTPFILSKHNNKKLYMAANKVFKTNDRGNSWEVISDDITRKLPRDKWPVMGSYWSVDAVAKNVSTSLYGMAVSLAESPVQEGLLYVGTDDGVIQTSTNDGKTWSKTTKFKSVPEFTYVSDILASKLDKNVVYASFDNRKRDDFTPYILKSIDQGKTWKSISNNLPKNGTVHTIEQDNIKPGLLFVGTEFGVFYSNNYGEKWTQLKSGIPAISVRDMVIQEREQDLVLATFGRGFYILDDYTPLREINTTLKEQKAHIFPIKEALLYVPKHRGGYGFGSMPYKAKNKPFGATFTYYLKETPQTEQAQRRKKEKELIKSKSKIPIPSSIDLYNEKNELAPYLLFTISDKNGNEVRKLTTKATKGINRITWNLRSLWGNPLKPSKAFKPLKEMKNGILVVPGTYQVKMDLVTNGITQELVSNTNFIVTRLNNSTLPAADEQILATHLEKLQELSRITWGTKAFHNELTEKINSLQQVALQSKGIPTETIKELVAISKELLAIKWLLDGEQPKASSEEIAPTTMAIIPRLHSIIFVHNQSTSSITQKEQDGYLIIKEKLQPIISQLNKISKDKIPVIENTLNKHKAPWTSGRVLEFKN